VLATGKPEEHAGHAGERLGRGASSRPGRLYRMSADQRGVVGFSVIIGNWVDQVLEQPG